MKRIAVLALVLLLSGSLSAKEEQHQWKALQVKHFTVKPGISLSPEYLGYLYDGLLQELRKSKLAEQVLDDSATVPQNIAADSVVMESTLTSIEKGGFPLRAASAHFEFKLYRVSDHRLITTQNWQSDISEHKTYMRNIGISAANEVKKTAKALQPLSSFPPAAPAEAV